MGPTFPHSRCVPLSGWSCGLLIVFGSAAFLVVSDVLQMSADSPWFEMGVGNAPPGGAAYHLRQNRLFRPGWDVVHP